MTSLLAKLTASTIGVVVLTTAVAFSFSCPGNAHEEADCPEPLAGVELSDRQLAKLWQLEEELDQQIEDIMPLSEEQESIIEALEERFESEVEALLSHQQKQQIETLDQWVDEQLMGLVPEWFAEMDDAGSDLIPEDQEPEESPLTPIQVRKLEELEETYDQRFQQLLSDDQRAQIARLEAELDEAIDSNLPEPTARQEEKIEVAETEFESKVTQLLTAEQRQQVEQNLACEWSEDE